MLFSRYALRWSHRPEESKATSPLTRGNDSFIGNKWNHKPVGSEQTLSRKALLSKWPQMLERMWGGCARSGRELTGFLLQRTISFDSNTTVWLSSFSSPPHRRPQAWCRFDVSGVQNPSQPIPIWVPWKLLCKRSTYYWKQCDVLLLIMRGLWDVNHCALCFL